MNGTDFLVESGKIKVEQTNILRTLILQAMKGSQGVGIALQELTNNSFDARADKIRFFIENSNTLVQQDDSSGFDTKGIISALSYGKSSRKRNDKSTTGANGTGLKSVLGLDVDDALKNVKVIIYSVSVEYPKGIRLEFDFEYLVKLAEKEISGRENITIGIDKKLFQYGWNRVTGTTIIITGYDPEKIKSSEKIIEQLSKILTPRAAGRVSVLNGNDFQTIVPEPIDGIFWDFQHESQSLGKIDFDIYYGGVNDGPILCGPINSALPFSDFFKELTKQQKERITRDWLSLGGHIYIERLNEYRDHNGSFTKEFFDKRICDDLVETLHVVISELKELHQQEATIKDKEQYDKLVKDICKWSREIYATPTNIIPNAENPKNHFFNYLDQDFYILPRRLSVKPKDKMEVVLNNVGTKFIDFKGAKWSCNSDTIKIFGSGQKATIHTTIETNAVVKIEGSFGIHEIKVFVNDTKDTPYIYGLKNVLAGKTYEYELKNYTDNNIAWTLSNAKGVFMKTGQGKKIIVTIPEQESQHDFVLTCKLGKKEIAKKTVYITEEGGIGKLPRLTVGKEDYLLAIGTHYKNCVAQLETDGPEEFSTIILNPIHEFLKGLNVSQKLPFILHNIAMAGCCGQIQKGIITPQYAMNVACEFVTHMQARAINKKQKKTK